MNENDIKVIKGGFLAGIAQTYTGHPFDTVKVRYVNNRNKYKNVMDCVNTIKSEGYSKFYRGSSSPLFGSIMMNISTFYLYNTFKEKTHDSFVSGAMTGAVLSLIESPTDLIKSRMQINIKSKYINTIKHARSYGGIYRGLSITAIRNIPSVGFYFSGYENTKKIVNKYTHYTHEYIGTLIGGSVAGFGCWSLTYPADVIKTVVQTDTRNQYFNIREAIVDIYKKQGIKGFWNGFTPCVTRAIIINPFVFMAYEIGTKYFQ